MQPDRAGLLTLCRGLWLRLAFAVGCSYRSAPKFLRKAANFWEDKLHFVVEYCEFFLRSEVVVGGVVLKSWWVKANFRRGCCGNDSRRLR